MVVVRRELRPWARWALVVVVVYLTVSHLAYRFAHPHLTETELLLRLPEAMAWHWEAD